MYRKKNQCMDKSSNPAFGKSALERIVLTGTDHMTASGTYLKTFFLLVVLVASASVSWNWVGNGALTDGLQVGALIGASLSALVLGLVISFKPTVAKYLSVPYAILQGTVLGVISGLFADQYEGIVGQAILATLGVFMAVYLGYALGVIKASSKFKKVIISCMIGILIYSGLSALLSVFGIGTSIYTNTSMFGIGFSVFVVIIAALSLVIDFDFIESSSEKKYPKYFEWYGAYGLMVGIVWLYMEILRLLAKLTANNR